MVTFQAHEVIDVAPYQRRTCTGDWVEWRKVPGAPEDEFIRWFVANNPMAAVCGNVSSNGDLKCQVDSEAESACYEYNMIGAKGRKPLDPHIIVE